MAKKRAADQEAPKKRAAAKGTTAKAAAEIYPLKITLAHVDPPVWRRVQVKDGTLADLHNVIQAAMGWEDCHMHAFKVSDREYGIAEPDEARGGWGDPDMGDSAEITLSALRAQGVKKFKYEYDFGDSWEHTIQFEKLVPAEDGAVYPRCVDGSGACPPEDCGGPWGYLDLLDILAGPKSDERTERLEWLGGDFDPDAFDLKAVNKQLKRLR